MRLGLALFLRHLLCVTIALTRQVPDAIVECELTHIARQPIDADRARAEHGAYEEVLRELGVEVIRLPATHELPDSVFVEDTAVVLDEIAIISRPGARSRRAELPSVENALGRYRSVVHITAPATLDGGDVLALDRELVVGTSERTNAEGIEQLRARVAPYGYAVRSAPVTGCLHLKSAVTRVGEGMLLINPAWTDASVFGGWKLIEVDAREPFAANALFLHGTAVYAEGFVNTQRRLEAQGCRVVTVPAGELAKAEGGVTCCSLLIHAERREGVAVVP